MSIPLSECFEAAHTVGAAPSFLERKFFKALGKMLPARNANLVLLLAAAVGALVSMRRYMMAKQPLFRVIHWLWMWTERAGRYLFTLALFFPVA